jgi:LCP family protein required for cell wall assembly
MDSNKSIDGLKTRSAKSGVSSSRKPQKSSKPAVKPTKPTTQLTKSTSKPVRATTKLTKITAQPIKTTTKPVRTTTKSTKTSQLPSADSTPAPTSTTRITTPSTTIAPTKASPKSAAPQESNHQETPLDILSTSAAEDFLKPTQIFDFDEKSGELKASDATPNTTSNVSNNIKSKKVKKPVSKKRKVITSIILFIVILLIGGVIWLVIWGNDIIAKITGGQGNVLDLLTFTEPTYNPLKTDSNGRTNVLAFGTSGYNMAGDEGNGTHDGAQLTDSIMVISFDQESKDVAMLSLPRDLKASPTCTATGKINEVYWCNDGGKDNNLETESKAANALMEEVSDILGIDFQYYAHLNWGSLVQIVDTLGGINVTLDEDIADYGWTNAVFEAGKEYTIDGEQALGLARARHGTASGDFTRGASQQKILIGIKDKIFENGLAITDIINLAGTLGDNLRTNFSLDEMRTLAHLMSDFDFDSARQVSLIEPEMLMTTGTINGISYVLPAGGANYYTRIQNHVAKMFSSNPRDYEDYSILVLNATETPGLATAEKNNLEEDEYQNIYIDDAPEGEYEGDYILYMVKDTAPGVKKLLEQKYNTTAKSLEELPTNISQDYHFVIIINKTESEAK